MVPAVPAQGYHGEQLTETRRQLRVARTRLSRLVQTDRQLAAIIADLSTTLSHTRSRLAGARSDLATIQAGIRSEERRLRELRRATARRSKAIEGRIRQLYILGPGYNLEALFTAASYEQFIARSSALDYLTRYDRIAMEELSKIRHDARTAREALVAERVRAATSAGQIAERERIQSEILTAKQQAEAKLDERISRERAEIAALEREQARISALIRSLGSTSTGPVSRRGFVWPIRGQITSNYGPRWGGFHTGIDIDCRTGQAIAASKAGRVIASGWQGGYGRAVIIDHGDGVSTLYAHMSAIYVGTGQSVEQRKRVGACGSTGNSTGDHLHFEVRIDGRHTNPRPFLP